MIFEFPKLIQNKSTVTIIIPISDANHNNNNNNMINDFLKII